ncbi:MAG: hypothetical protein JO331_10995 [Verrucomicrobia bacterium]|nr:hypothetical protein [Verrucomicrobiota bacterium]
MQFRRERTVPSFFWLVLALFRRHLLTWSGAADGTPPAGRTVAYPVAVFTQVEGDKIRSEHVYLDRQTGAEQLGLKPK